MFDDTQIRLSALQLSSSLLLMSGETILGRADAFYDFLTAGPKRSTAQPNEPGRVVVEPLPLADHPPIETQPEAAKRTRRTKAQIEADNAAASSQLHGGSAQAADAVAAAAESTAAGPAPASEPTTAGDLVTMKAALMRVVSTDGLGPNAAMGIVKKHGGGASKVSVVEEKYYAAVEAACLAALYEVAK